MCDFRKSKLLPSHACAAEQPLRLLNCTILQQSPLVILLWISFRPLQCWLELPCPIRLPEISLPPKPLWLRPACCHSLTPQLPPLMSHQSPPSLLLWSTCPALGAIQDPHPPACCPSGTQCYKLSYGLVISLTLQPLGQDNTRVSSLLSPSSISHQQLGSRSPFSPAGIRTGLVQGLHFCLSVSSWV